MLYAIQLKTIPRGIPAWLGRKDSIYIGPPDGARKFKSEADAECFMKGREFPGFNAEVVKLSDENQWGRP